MFPSFFPSSYIPVQPCPHTSPYSVSTHVPGSPVLTHSVPRFLHKVFPGSYIQCSPVLTYLSIPVNNDTLPRTQSVHKFQGSDRRSSYTADGTRISHQKTQSRTDTENEAHFLSHDFLSHDFLSNDYNFLHYHMVHL